MLRGFRILEDLPDSSSFFLSKFISFLWLRYLANFMLQYSRNCQFLINLNYRFPTVLRNSFAFNYCDLGSGSACKSNL